MIERIFFVCFLFFGAIYVFMNFFSMAVLKNAGKKVKFFDVDFSNYRELRDLSKENQKFKTLYTLFLMSTFLPVLTFILFIIYLFLNVG